MAKAWHQVVTSSCDKTSQWIAKTTEPVVKKECYDCSGPEQG